MNLLKRVFMRNARDTLPRSWREFPVRIDRIWRIDLPPCGASDGPREQAVREALALTMGSQKDAPVGLVIPPGLSLVRSCKLPPISPTRLREVVCYEAQQTIPFDLDEVVWDSMAENVGECYECCIVACRCDVIQRELAGFQAKDALRRRLDLIQIGELTFADYLWNCHFVQSGCLNTGIVLGLDMHASGTLLLLSDGKAAWTRWIPIGREHLEPVNSDHAIADWLAEIQRSIGFFISTQQRCRLSGVVFRGVGSLLKQRVQETTIAQEVLIPFANGAEQSPALAPSVIANHGGGVTDAITVAIQRLGIGKYRVNLHPESRGAFGLGVGAAWGISIQPDALVAVLVSRK